MKKILIVEDDQNIAELERDYLAAHHYEVEIARTGSEGLKRAQNNPYDLILLDLMLPFMDGFEICRELRKTKDIPILMVSAKTEDIDKIRGLGIGADDYIVKPFNPNELVARVNAHIARYERLVFKSTEKPDVLSMGRLYIDKKDRRVFINKNEIPLTNKEFELLVFLASNPNIVFSKDQLFDKIWGMESMGDTATVTVHIKRIREKIEEDLSTPQYIETVWGAGYRFKL